MSTPGYRSAYRFYCGGSWPYNKVYSKVPIRFKENPSRGLLDLGLRLARRVT